MFAAADFKDAKHVKHIANNDELKLGVDSMRSFFADLYMASVTSYDPSLPIKSNQEIKVEIEKFYKKKYQEEHSKKIKLNLPILETITKNKIPTDVIKQLTPYLDKSTLNTIKQTNKKLYQSSKLNELFEYIVCDNLPEAEKIIKKHPEFLMSHGSVKTISNDIIEDVTPLELAFGEQYGGMFYMLSTYLELLPEKSRYDILVKFTERFPEIK